MNYAQVHTGLDDLTFQAEMAGAALGCHFSSSAEYEAALIAERRKAGAYRVPLWQRPASWTLALAVMFLLAAPWYKFTGSGWHGYGRTTFRGNMSHRQRVTYHN
jgi:hypothetical protein